MGTASGQDDTASGQDDTASGQDEDLLLLFDFCPGSSKASPATKASTDLAMILFELNRGGKHAVALVQAKFGATVHWPAQVLRKSVKNAP